MKRNSGKICTALVSLAVILTIPLVFSHPAASAVEYTFTPIDLPDAYFTSAFGINNHGDIVGTYWDTKGIPHGFLYANGDFTTIDFPGAIGTVANGINNVGDIVGVYVDAAGILYGFLYVGGNFTAIDVDGASVTWPFGINNCGDIVGAYQDATGSHGFLATQGKAKKK